jgi:hypothetical protein
MLHSAYKENDEFWSPIFGSNFSFDCLTQLELSILTINSFDPYLPSHQQSAVLDANFIAPILEVTQEHSLYLFIQIVL